MHVLVAELGEVGERDALPLFGPFARQSRRGVVLEFLGRLVVENLVVEERFAGLAVFPDGGGQGHALARVLLVAH